MTISVKELLDALGGKLSEDAVERLTGRLRHLSPAALLSLADQAAIRITGDGNVIGSNNQVFVLKGEGLEELARLLRAASQTGQALHQLPPPPGDFTGRTAELKELTQAIEKGGVTISGLRGMGGIGKTALALKLAEKLRERYPDAQVYLDLKGTSEKPLTAAEAMAHVVRAYHPTDKLPDNEAELAGVYRSVLDGQRALLLMDNAMNAAQVAPLAPPASCVLLVTSRQRFVLRGWVAKDLTTLTPEEARALLLRLAPRIGDAADEIAQLCGCLPLALCAAGGMLAAREDLPPHRYAEQLRDERQRLQRLGEEGVEISVEASLNLSYASLEPEAAHVFRQLAVFPGSFDAGAEEVVCNDPEHKSLSELLRRSLVEYDGAADRYRLHDLTRLFAASRQSDQERGHAERRHAAHYLEVASAAQRLYLKGGDAILAGPGLFFIIPIFETVPYWIDIRVIASAFRAEKTLTKDTVPVDVDAVLFWRVIDPQKAALDVADYSASINWAAQTALRDVIGKTVLADMLEGRGKLGDELQIIIDARTEPWGISVISVEVKDVQIPAALQDAMSMQAQAERERQARVILGDSERQVAEKFGEAAKTYADNPTAFHLRAMNMLYEGLKRSNATIVIVPSTAVESMQLGGAPSMATVASAIAHAQAAGANATPAAD